MDEELQNHIGQLLKIQSEVNEIRMEGESYINELQENHGFDLLRLSCSVILSDQEIPIPVIQLSFILINRNRLFVMNNWSNLTPDQQIILRTAAMRGLFFQDQVIRSLSSLTFCLITKCGIVSYKQELFKQLAIPICNTEYAPCCTVGCFMALKELVHQGDIIQVGFPSYEELGMVVIDAFVKIMNEPKVFEILDFIEFLKCYRTILPFFQTFYQNEESLKSFLNLVYKNLQIENSDIHSSLYDLLFSFFKCFYEHIDSCMDLIFEMAANSLSMIDSPDFLRPAINFWQNIAKYEIMLTEAYKSTGGENFIFHKIVDKASLELMDQLMLITTRYVPESAPPSLELEEIEKMNSNSVCQAAIDCLREFSALTDKVIKKLGPEFDHRIESPEWQDRLAAIYSLWCISQNQIHNIDVSILKDNKKVDENQTMFELNQFYENRFDALIHLSNDPVEIVRIEALDLLAVLFRVDRFISGQRRFLRRILACLNQIVFGLKRSFNEGQIGPVSDVVFGKICNIILEIGKQNIKKREKKDIVYNRFRKHKKKKKKNSTVPEVVEDDIENDEENKIDEEKRDDEEEEEFEEHVKSEENPETEVPIVEDIYRIMGSETPNTVFSIYFFKFLRILFNIFDFPIFQTQNYVRLQEKCTEAISTIFSATPVEQGSYVLDFYLQNIFQHIALQFEILSRPPVEGISSENIDCTIRIRQLCIILSSIVHTAGCGIRENADQIISFLIKCLTMKNVPIHEEALIGLGYIIDADVNSIEAHFPQILEIFFISQDSQNDFIVRKSAEVLLKMFLKIENLSSYINQIQTDDPQNPTMMGKILNVFIKNLKDNEISLQSRLEVVKTIGIIIEKIKIAAEPFLPTYAEILTNYQKISFSFFLEEEVEDATLLYITILNGYGDLLKASDGLDFFLEYMQNFKSIIQFIDSIGRFDKCLNKDLKKAVLNYISIVFDNLPAMKSANLSSYRAIKGLLNRKIKPILALLSNDDDKNEIAPEAASLFFKLRQI